MTFNHLVLIGGGHTNALLMNKWLMHPKLMPDIPISIISRDSHLVYSAMFPSVLAKTISLDEALIDIQTLARNTKISFIKEEVRDIDHNLKKIVLDSRPAIYFSKLVLNYGSQTKIPRAFKELLKNQIAFPIKPFLESYKLIIKEDIYDSEKELPFVIVGSGLAAIEVAFALRKRWQKRFINLLCYKEKMDKKILKSLRNSNINLVDNLNFDHGKILLCTGNTSPLWVQEKFSATDSQGRLIVNQNLKLKSNKEIFATGDCAIVDSYKRHASGIYAVKALNTLVHNLKKDIDGKPLKKWFPQKFGLQIVNSFQNNNYLLAFAICGDFVIGPSSFLGSLKNIIDRNFIKEFRLKNKLMKFKEKDNSINDCRGCAAKITQGVLNSALRHSKLNSFADSPEDAVEIYKNEKEVILQSVDGFPALLSDPWLNAKITTLHACSDIWASGAKISSAQAIISLPKLEENSQKYLFSQCLEGIKSTVEEQGGKLIGGHTYESRNLVSKPYPMGVEISLSVQGALKNGTKPWLKSGMQIGDVILMSRPLGVGIFFAGQMQNINMRGCYSEIMKNLVTSQQSFIDKIYSLQDQLGETIINASTDITGYGLIGHLKEMIESSNLLRKKNNLPLIKASLNLCAFKAYPGIYDLIRKKIKSSLFESNKEIYEQIIEQSLHNRIISFSEENFLDKESLSEKISLLLDPQTCGPLLISCHPKFEMRLGENWYKVGEVLER